MKACAWRSAVVTSTGGAGGTSGPQPVTASSVASHIVAIPVIQPIVRLADVTVSRIAPHLASAGIPYRVGPAPMSQADRPEPMNQSR